MDILIKPLQIKIINKFILFIDLFRLAFFARSFTNAFFYLRQDYPLDLILCHFRRFKFYARRQDWPVIREIFFHREYDCIRYLFEEKSRVKILDLGAHIGAFALVAAHYYKNSKIYSVEAAPDTADILKKNIKINSNLKWKLIRGAVWSNNGPIYLHRSKSSLGHHVENIPSGELVKSYTLDDLYKKTGWKKIDLIKMDIEGAELTLIRFNSKALARAKFVLIEIHGDDQDIQSVKLEVKNIFPSVYRIKNRGSCKPIFLFAKKDISLPVKWEFLKE